MLVLTCIGIYVCNTAQLDFCQLVLCQIFMLELSLVKQKTILTLKLSRRS